MFSTLFLRLLVLQAVSFTLATSALANVSVIAAGGGESISADTAADAAAPAWTSLGAIIIAEPTGSTGDIGGGTLILKAPTGFQFNTATVPSIAYTPGRNITAASVAVTDSSTVTITLTVAGSDAIDSITIGGTTPLQARPAAGAPLASGNISRPASGGGTAVVAGILTSTNVNGAGGTSFGTLQEIAGAAKQLALQAALPSTATASIVFSPQPVILVQDQFGNTRNAANGAADNLTVVTAARGLGTGTLQGTANATSVNGVASFSNLSYPQAETITIVFSSSGLTSVTSGSIVVSPTVLTVRANDLTRDYGAANPPLTVSYTGFVNGETLATSGVTGSPSVSTTADTSSPIGAYPIVVAAGTLASSKYSFAFVNGTLSVVPPGTLFMDSFTRLADPGPLAPWIVQAGNWSVTGGALLGGTNALSSYGFVYLTNSWADYSAQARVKLSPGAFGAGLATRLNPATGARYAAWIYPEGSPGGSNVLRLLEFQSWTGVTAMQQASLPGVGTNWHSLKLVARGNRLAACYDGNLVLSFTDTNAQPLLSGGLTLEFWTDATGYTMSADDVLVSLPGGVLVSNDTYSVRQSATLTVAAPGVLANDTTEMGGLTAQLVAGPAHGTLSLSTNGGFTYLPVAGYLGTDTFTYQAQDGSSTSSVATVTITVTPNHAPNATNDSYTLMANTTLTVPAPGLVANDSDPDGDSLTAVLVSGPSQGTVSLNSNGGFTYVPPGNYIGSDSFTYKAFDGMSNSAVATVSLSVTAFSPWLSDAFTRTSLSPWVVQAGNWALSGGVLQGGTNTPASYGYTYLTNQWGDCSVQAQVQLSTGGFGGGLDGRLNPATGAHYAAWIYPEGSPGGSSVLKLLKFQNWSQFSLLQQVSLPGVGTNWHSLKLVMQGNRIAVHYDGTMMLSVTDLAAPLLVSGGIGFDLWTDTTPWTLTADNVTVNAVLNVLATNDNYTVRMAGTLTVSPPGVLGNDAGQLGALTAVLAGNPAHGTLTFNTNGGFTYVPVSTYSGSDTFTYQATDGVSTSSPATVTVSITPNHAPTAANDSYSATMNTTLTVPAPGILANDTDPDGDTLQAVLASGPSHGSLSLSTNGGFVYTPAAGYTGPDTFTYWANDGLASSSVATVSLSVAVPGPLLTDDFTRTNPPGALSPWVVQAGNWAVNDGLLTGGPNALNTYGHFYFPTNWTDYEAQARILLPAGSFGGGLAGRLNPATGTRYALWIYPEGSSGGSNVWKLLKFQNWDSFTVMQQGNLPGVGTSWHTAKIGFQGNHITLYYDSTSLATVTDSQPYASGGISFDLWTAAASYIMVADDVLVTKLAPGPSVTLVGMAVNKTNNTATATFLGAAGTTYLVQASTNPASPASWLTLSTNVAGADGRWTYTDALTNLPRRFYRSATP